MLRAVIFVIFELCFVKERMKTQTLVRGIILMIGLAVALLAMALESPAQSHEGYIYGKVYTDRTTYVGPIR